MDRDTRGWVRAFELRDALWLHSGDPHQPHALLTSGMHSGAFVNCRKVMEDECLARRAVGALVTKISRVRSPHLWVDFVIGPQTGATKLALLLAEEIARREQRQACVSLSPAKVTIDGQKRMRFTDQEVRRLRDAIALMCEDVITTGESVVLTDEEVRAAQASTLPFVVCLVNRSGKTWVGGMEIFALIDHYMPTWHAHECPLCALGSIALRPKDNWAALTGRM